jgi:hypothetical protein
VISGAFQGEEDKSVWSGSAASRARPGASANTKRSTSPTTGRTTSPRRPRRWRTAQESTCTASYRRRRPCRGRTRAAERATVIAWAARRLVESIAA